MSDRNSLSESFRSVSIPKSSSFFRKLLAYSGPGYLVAVGYMDPGNWATDLQGGAHFGYALLVVILTANLIAILVQYLSLKLGIATGRDLAQMCRENFSKPVSTVLWLMSEIMIIACDLAEVIGSAIALNLLFNIPLLIGVIVTVADVFLFLLLQHKGFRYIEALVVIFIFTIVTCFGIEIFLSKPEFVQILNGFIPTANIFTNKEMLYISLGIIGATVMPHNIFLHSSVVQTRQYALDIAGKKEAIRFATIDTIIALTFAFFVNASILIVSAATFYNSGNRDVAEISQAYWLMAPILGTTVASIVFALALLISGQNSTLTGTMTGQIIMEGFVDLKIKPWIRRVVTRSLAIVPAVLVIIFFKDYGINNLLVLSQVVLSIQLPFALIPLVVFTNSRQKMGEFVNGRLIKITSTLVAGIIVSMNFWLLYSLWK